ncbi:hypothetical protein B296_00046189 [Ensete ventricosum]|uniref:Uncharacterized protein n=1 Tax=Ensete ventricosum TaxID=4639 RepID=A0A426XHR4_ENSVE|nr:hypothetical protein B296_00046189 [Ensete ventricosum]
MATASFGEEEVPSMSFMTRRQRKDVGALGRGDCNGDTSASAGRQRRNRGEATLAVIAEGWPQEKRGWADLARKIDGREEANNNAVGRGRGPQLLRLPGLQGQMRAELSVVAPESARLGSSRVRKLTCVSLSDRPPYDLQSPSTFASVSNDVVCRILVATASNRSYPYRGGYAGARPDVLVLRRSYPCLFGHIALDRPHLHRGG